VSRLAVRAARLVVAGSLAGPEGPATILVEDGTIARILPGHPPVDGPVVGEGCDVVTPGLIDVHTHGAAGVQTIDGDVGALRRLGAFYATHGVTAYLATIGGSPPAIEAGLRAARDLIIGDPREPAGAQCLGAHLEGPFINCCCPGAFDPASIIAPDLAVFERYAATAAGTLRHITLAPEVAGQHDVIRAAGRAGITCSAGHSAATETQMLEAIELGVGAVTHMFNAMPPMHHRDPGIVGVALTDPRLVAELIADGVHVHPRIIELLNVAKTPQRIALVTDSIAATGLSDGDYHFEERPITVHNRQARLADGTLAGSTLTLDDAVANFAAYAGISWDDAVVSATTTPARLLGIDDRKGRLDVGYDADLVGWSPGHRVRWTIVRGRPVPDAAATG